MVVFLGGEPKAYVGLDSGLHGSKGFETPTVFNETTQQKLAPPPLSLPAVLTTGGSPHDSTSSLHQPCLLNIPGKFSGGLGGRIGV